MLRKREGERNTSSVLCMSYKRDEDLDTSLEVSTNMIVERRAKCALLSATVDKDCFTMVKHDDGLVAEFQDINIDGAIDNKGIDKDFLFLTEAACTSDSLCHSGEILEFSKRSLRVIW